MLHQNSNSSASQFATDAVEQPATETIAKPKLKSVIKLVFGLGETLRWLLPKAVVATVIAAAAWAIWKAYQQGDLVAVAAGLMVAAGALYGYWRGIVGSVISLVGIAVAYFIAAQLGVAYEHLVAAKFGTTGILNRGLAIGLAAVLVYFVFNLVSTLVLKLLASQSGERSVINQTLGLVGGATQATLCVLLFLSGFSVIKPMLPAAAELTEARTAANWFSMLSTAIEQSQLRPWMERYNPFERVPQLEKVKGIQQAICKLDGPDQVRHLMRHPSVMELRKNTEMKKAVRGLAGDPEFVDLMTGKKPLDKSTVHILLRSDAVLKLIEQPGFLKTAWEILNESSESESTSTSTLYTSKSE